MTDDPYSPDLSATAKNIFDDCVDKMDKEDQQKNAVIVTYHALNTFRCNRMEAYEEVGKVYHLSQTTVRKL